MAVEIRLVAALSALFFLPGAALLFVGEAWRLWDGLQRYIVAVGLSIALVPLLFYTVDFWLPWVRLGRWMPALLLLLATALVVWGVRRHGVEAVRIDGYEWAAVGLILLTLISRFWVLADYPYPAWTDSLHHSLMTRLVAEQGVLPETLLPYFDVSLHMYHKGFHALSATTQWLAGVPADQAVVWTAQMLNGLCGVGVYLMLDRFSGAGWCTHRAGSGRAF